MTSTRQALHRTQFHFSPEQHSINDPNGLIWFDGDGLWECPDRIPLPATDGSTVWLLKVDVFGGHPSAGSGARVRGAEQVRHDLALAADDGLQLAMRGSPAHTGRLHCWPMAASACG
jgi:hypothetical protein